ncbi:hypothetical protein C8Q79DRAFT_939193 [Trametes meyenii]|nr:hypothetical protein C8Q79DRAFT_939193 [Trametes meyenii]
MNSGHPTITIDLVSTPRAPRTHVAPPFPSLLSIRLSRSAAPATRRSPPPSLSILPLSLSLSLSISHAPHTATTTSPHDPGRADSRGGRQVLDRLQTKEVLRAVLHAVLFHRLFGTVKPRTFEVLDVTMPGVEDGAMAELVEKNVDAFWRGVEGGVNKRGQILVTLSEKRPRKSWFLMGGEEEIPWEQWVINAEIRQPSDRERQKFNAELAATLTKSLQTMLVYSSSEKGRSVVPLITDAQSISPFPIKMTVKVGGVEVA